MKNISYPVFPYFTRSDLSIGVVFESFRERIQLLQLTKFAGLTFVLVSVIFLCINAIVSIMMPQCVHQVVTDITDKKDLNVIIQSVILLSGALFLLQLIEKVRSYAGKIAAKRIDGKVREQVRNLILSSRGIERIEQEEFKRTVMQASDQGLTWRVRSAGTAAVGQMQLIARLISVLGMTISLAWYFPLLASFLFISTYLLRAIGLRQWLYLENFKDDRISEKIKVDYWTNLAMLPEYAKEIRIFGLSAWVSNKRYEAHLAWLSEYWYVRRRILNSQLFPAFLAMLNGALALYVPGEATLNGDINEADLSACLVAAWGIFRIGTIGGEAYDIEYGKTAAKALNKLNLLFPPESDVGDKIENITPTIVLDNVDFTYPGSARPIFKNFNLSIKPGERLAIVGVNGVGKTTLIKLIAGLYKPTSGYIKINGYDLNKASMSSWREKLSVLFQDFIRYPLSIRENITASVPDITVSDHKLMMLLQSCGAEEIINKGEHGFDTEMWRTGTKGNDLSGGEWQKLALARVIFATQYGRKVIILDEPTAHMDVHAEVEFYNRIDDLAKDCTVIIISHRLSTVRAAERIILLSNGNIAEQGTHHQLMEINGVYADLYKLQANRFGDKTLS